MGSRYAQTGWKICFLTAILSWQALDSPGQDAFRVTQYTSRDGLPQNSIRGLAFDEFGFLWIATEGGLARFDGTSFKVAGPKDHPELNNQRFTHALTCNDSTILFLDVWQRIYRLSGNEFSTLGNSGIYQQAVLEFHGGFPNPLSLVQDSLLRAEIKNSKRLWTSFPAGKNRLFVVTDRLGLLDSKQQKRRWLQKGPFDGRRFAQLGGQLVFLDQKGQLQQFHLESNTFSPCLLVDKAGKPWKKTFKQAHFYSRHPFQLAFIQEGNQLYVLTPTSSPGRFAVRKFLHALPGKTQIISLDYRAEDQLLAIGTSTKGLFLYRKKSFQTFIHKLPDESLLNSYYAQALLDSTSLLLSTGLILDPQTMSIKGRFPYPFYPYQLAKDPQGQLYFSVGRTIYQYDLRHPNHPPKTFDGTSKARCLVPIDSAVWAVLINGIYQIKKDSMHLVYPDYFSHNRRAISLIKDNEEKLWLGTLDQLFHLDLQTQRLDSLPAFRQAETRALVQVRDMLFIGTFGKGYFIYKDGRLWKMPTGPNHELSNVHAFIEDQEGYLWIPTNSGLYKTRLDAIEAYLQDTTRELFYYVYQDEDGIRNAEFNGGCNPSYLWLPDGRLSLPTIEGMVFFNPSHTHHFLNQDSLLFTRIQINGKPVSLARTLEIPADHYGIDIRFATAWWGHLANLDLAYRLDGLQAGFQKLEPRQRVISFGHLKPGNYTLILRKRTGFGTSDFVYTRLPISVLPPWYATPYAFILYGLTFLLTVWGTSVLYSRSIRHRNYLLQQKVEEQTAELRKANVLLGQNIDKLHRSERELRDNLEMKDRLISVISHDILTPLRFIGMIARLGDDEKQRKAFQMRKALGDVQNAVSKLYWSTLNVIHWVKFQKDSFELRPTHCSPFVLVEKLILELSEMAAYQGNQLINEVPEDDVILTDPQLLTIVLNNLLSNAIKFTKKGRITVRSYAKPGWYALEVKDTGRGMSDQQIQDLRQGKTGQKQNRSDVITAGTGMGLSLVANLVKALGGRWEIQSPEGKGVSVQLFIPWKTKEATLPDLHARSSRPIH